MVKIKLKANIDTPIYCIVASKVYIETEIGVYTAVRRGEFWHVKKTLILKFL